MTTRRAGVASLLLVACGALALFGFAVGDRDLWNPNEPIYGLAVREMVEHGEPWTPTVNGEPFFEKPPLYYALARVAVGVAGGVSEGVLRWPSVLAGMALVGLSWWLGRRVGLAWSTAFLVATTFVVFWSARSIQMDLLLTTCVAAAVIVGHEALLTRGALRSVGMAVAGACAGLAVLAKGPVGLAIPLVVLGGAAAAADLRRSLRLTDGALFGGAVALVILPVAWILQAHGVLDGYLGEMFRQNVTRSLAPWDHVEPWWYYLRYFWIDMAPWSFLVPLAVGLSPRSDDERRLQRLAWIWILLPVLLFSLAPSKRSVYILPIVPAVGLLAAMVVQRMLAGELGRRRRQAIRTIGVGWGALLLAAAGVVLRFEGNYPDLRPAALAVAGVMVVGGAALVGAALLYRRFPRLLPPVAAVVPVALYLLAAGWVLPALDGRKSARPFAEQVRRTVGEQTPLYSYRMWRWRASYPYYLGRTIPRLTTPDELARTWDRPERVCVLAEDAMREEVAVALEVDPVLSGRVGSKIVEVFCSRRPPHGVQVSSSGRRQRVGPPQQQQRQDDQERHHPVFPVPQ